MSDKSQPAEAVARAERAILSAYEGVGGDEAGGIEGCQMIGGEWWAPQWGCDTADHIIEAVARAIEAAVEDGRQPLLDRIAQLEGQGTRMRTAEARVEALEGIALSPRDYPHPVKGCGDTSCLIQKPSGMATNGGCRCDAKRYRRAIHVALGEDADGEG